MRCVVHRVSTLNWSIYFPIGNVWNACVHAGVLSILKSCWSSMHLLFLHDSGKFRHSHGTESSSTRFHLTLPIHTCTNWINCRVSTSFSFPFNPIDQLYIWVCFKQNKAKQKNYLRTVVFKRTHKHTHTWKVLKMSETMIV